MEFRTFVEKRESTRIRINASVFISHEGRLYSGRVVDLAIRSVRVQMNCALPVGAKVDVIVVAGPHRLEFRGVITRKSTEDIVLMDSANPEGRLRGLYFQMA